MIRYQILFLILFHSSIALVAQKRPLDNLVKDSWPEIKDPQISNDGSYALYTIESKSKGAILVLKATDNSWERVILGAHNAVITGDSKRAIYSTLGDSIEIL